MYFFMNIAHFRIYYFEINIFLNQNLPSQNVINICIGGHMVR